MTGKSPNSSRGAKPQQPGSLGRRQIISAWDVLVWAYQRECVRIIRNIRERRAGYGNSSMVSIERALNNCSFGGTVHEPPEPPHDATEIDDFAQDCLPDYAQYMVIVTAAESGVPIARDIAKPPMRPRPKEEPRWRNFMGDRCCLAPYIIHPINRRPWFTPIIWVGYDADDLERLRDLQRRRHELLHSFLGVMEADLILERFVIRGLGLTPCDESLTKGSTLSALRAGA